METDIQIALPAEIRSNLDGYSQLTMIAEAAKDLSYGSLEIDMANVRWFDANMSAVFGAVLFEVSERLNEVRIVNIPEAIEGVLAKNTFLCNFGELKKNDNYKTTIPFQRFDISDQKFFSSYIDDAFSHLETSENKLRLDESLRKGFVASLYEVFNNSLEHSETKLGIFSCGQFFLRQRRLEFTVADLGIGIRDKVRLLRPNIEAEEAIMWALEKNASTGSGNTTKHGPRPGGLGLKVVKQLIWENKGRLQIVSDCGYYEMDNIKESTSRLESPFRGTVVNISINTESSVKGGKHE